MKKFIIACLMGLMAMGLVACGTVEYTPPEIPDSAFTGETSEPSTEIKGATEAPAADNSVYSCLRECKEDIHDELFDKQTPESQLVIDLLFEELEVEPIESKFCDDGILVTAEVTNINAGVAVVDVFKEYAMLCAENAFSTNPMTNDELYDTYSQMLTESFEDAKRITRTVTILMEKKRDMWVCDLDDIAIDAITGNLFSAMVIEVITDYEQEDSAELETRVQLYREMYGMDDDSLAIALIQDGYPLDAITKALNP